MKMFRERLTVRVLLAMTISVVSLGYLGWRLFNHKSVEVVAVIQFHRPQHVLQPSVPEDFDLDEFIEEQKQLISLRAVLSKAVESTMRTTPALFEAETDPVVSLAEHLETEMISRRLMEVRLTGNAWTPEERVKLLQSVIDAYLVSHKDIEAVRLQHLMSILKEERQQREEILVQQHEALEKFENEKPTDAALHKRELAFGRQELEASSAVYARLVSRIEELQVNGNSPSRVSILDAPSIRKQ